MTQIMIGKHKCESNGEGRGSGNGSGYGSSYDYSLKRMLTYG